MVPTFSVKRGATLALEAPPTTSRAGETASFHLSNGPNVITLPARHESGQWTATILSAKSRELLLGAHAVQLYTELNDESALAWECRLLVEPSLLAGGIQDAATFAEKALAAAEAALLQYVDGADSSFSVDGDSFAFESRADLLALRNRFKRTVELERKRGALGIKESSRRTRVQFA